MKQNNAGEAGQFTKRPIPISAIRLTEKTIFAVYSFIHGKPDLSHRIAGDKWGDYENIVKRDGLKLKTLESENQTQTADIGDWIIKGVRGEFYPIKDDIFRETYQSYDNIRQPAEPTAWVRIESVESLPKIDGEYLFKYRKGGRVILYEVEIQKKKPTYDGDTEIGESTSSHYELAQFIAWMSIPPYTEPEDSDENRA